VAQIEFDWKGFQEKVRHLLYELEHDGVLRSSGSDIHAAMTVVHGMIGTWLKLTPEFPLYLMRAGDEFEFLSLKDAGVLYDNGFRPVDFGNLVLEEDLKVRAMTDDEKREISRLADEYSASK